tara:strand:+ start:349 stop:552 length:204 start_codon:yes stop_codon:yes gene_type:complete
MKAGNLVKVTRARIGTPSGTLGLIVEVLKREVDVEQPVKSWDFLYIVQLFGQTGTNRFLWRDLEVLS